MHDHDSICEADCIHQLLALILDLDERANVEFAFPDFAGQGVAQAENRSLSGDFKRWEYHPFLIRQEHAANRKVEVEARHGPQTLQAEEGSAEILAGGADSTPICLKNEVFGKKRPRVLDELPPSRSFPCPKPY